MQVTIVQILVKRVHYTNLEIKNICKNIRSILENLFIRLHNVRQDNGFTAIYFSKCFSTFNSKLTKSTCKGNNQIINIDK